jgi:hypothetical protein
LISGLVDQFARSNEVSDLELSRQLIGALRNGDFLAAVHLADSISEQKYGNPELHFRMNQLASLVRKVPLQVPGLQPEQEAWKKFQACEHLCKRTNTKLRAERLSARRRYSFLRDTAREWILSLIGSKPILPQIYKGCNFGPGASVGVHGSATHTAAKLCAEDWTVTPTALAYAQNAMMGEPLIWEMLQNRDIFCLDTELFSSLFKKRSKLVTANKITMVPKTAKVHRTIAIEPLLNGYLQLGVNAWLVKRLKRFGIDLGDQTANNVKAFEGSLGGFDPFVTIDLSGASDTVSIQIVKDMLPSAWFEFLDQIRSPSYESKWGSGRYEKFVSMGNGFCFPLETIIFASLAYAVNVFSFGEPKQLYGAPCRSGGFNFQIYGDDIIVRQHAALLLIEVLRYLGFRVNTKKTFLFGPFRESCGADYFEGVNVRPYELDFIPVTNRDLFKIANGARRVGCVFSYDYWNFIVSKIPPHLRFLRPASGPDDTALTVSLPYYMASNQHRWCTKIQTWTWLEYLDTAVLDERRVSNPVAMYGILQGSRPNRFDPSFALRRRVRTTVRRVPDCRPTHTSRVGGR